MEPNAKSGARAQPGDSRAGGKAATGGWMRFGYLVNNSIEMPTELTRGRQEIEKLKLKLRKANARARKSEELEREREREREVYSQKKQLKRLATQLRATARKLIRKRQQQRLIACKKG